jgi:hypothetical protein
LYRGFGGICGYIPRLKIVKNREFRA